ncbi:hypothetical protein BO78DRAFT_401318 [Aspergillus sclerotiicarbonarius CBS 121057]|uniref:Uncharacterized protein n=1 Tax=Aspergillus sclerotiicarbonarius (strain CBS 121057 / IBT 28362) TaxID=1448318 RepID=A0A319DZ64_ASPSB|nr:hypothetical protein BO78DRAFT_401318 [Aspergillus sclerotiicarbonarius CBS 121057]
MSDNSTSTMVVIDGWVDEPDGRGTWSIISTCLVTIALCCWTAVMPNIPARADRWHHALRDRLHLASLGLLGPEFLLMLALGQWSSARASVKDFERIATTKTSEPSNWTLTHAFYADMGGFLLDGPGVDRPFPVNAKQLFFLTDKGYIDPPRITEDDINDRNKSDAVSRVIAVCQALWLLINCAIRVAQGLALTTLELTTISFVIVFLVTSFCWRFKPSDITSTVTVIVNTRIDIIRQENCPHPQNQWHETPLDFVCDGVSFCGVHWRYYTEILRRWHIPMFSRPMTAQPRDRILSDNFPVTDLQADCIATPVLLLFGSMFMLAWNFHFPSRVEHLLWRVASIYNLLFTVIGGLHAGYCDKIVLPRAYKERLALPLSRTRPPQKSNKGWGRLRNFAARLRNIDPYRDPRREVPLRVLFPTTVLCAMYCVCRAYILTEDFIGLRSLPASAYNTVSWSDYVPHL